MSSLLSKIKKAHQVIRPQVRVTPLEFSPLLSSALNCMVYLKCENLQQTGSFKFRGAVNKLLSLSELDKQRGVITASTGNHGQAMALAGSLLNIPVTVYAPATAAKIKLDKIAAYGGKIELITGDALNAEIAAGVAAKQQMKVFVSPYNDYDVIAGQGTTAIELLEQQSDLDAIFVSVGGGGLISGIGTVIKALSPRTKVIACWPENATSMYSCIKANDYLDIDEQDTISDGTAGGVEPDAVTLQLCQEVIDRCVLVSEKEIKQAMKMIAQTDAWIIEGAAGVALASAIKLADEFKGKKVAILLCGRNIVFEKFMEAMK